jgi:hypothetical protein
MRQMKATLYLGASIMVGIALLPSQASACDPQEGCNRCLVNNPFGGCAVQGNDPVCEARKAACNACMQSKAAASGASVVCVVCVSAAIGSGGAVGPACAGVCGGAGFAAGVAQLGGC